MPNEITETAEAPASPGAMQPRQQPVESAPDKIVRQAEKLNDEACRILKGKQQLITRKRQEGEPLDLFVGRKTLGFFINGVIELQTLSNDITKRAKEKIENARQSSDTGAVQKQELLNVLGTIPTALVVFPLALFAATADSVLAVDTHGRRETAGRFPEWKDVQEAEMRLANDTRKLAEDARKLLGEEELSPSDARKLTALAKQLDAKAQRRTETAQKTVKLALAFQPANTVPATETAPSVPSTDEANRIDNVASSSRSQQEEPLIDMASPAPSADEAGRLDVIAQPSRQFQEKLIGQKRSYDQLERGSRSSF